MEWTKNVIYALFCNKCNKKYIGETKRQFITRWKEHAAATRHNRDTPVAKHIPASIATLAQRWPLRWANVGSPTLGQRGFVNWPNVDPTVARHRWPNVVPTSAQRWHTNVGPTVAQRYANGCMPTLCQHWPNGGCVTVFCEGNPQVMATAISQ